MSLTPIKSSSTTVASVTAQKSLHSNLVPGSMIPMNFDKESAPGDSADKGNGGPQCCHCGWRGSHAPNCPFK
ncbi:unnamed protein product [Somion occarium]|uniref:CCHC-type domain-containing protein n=1 Tax=Somion occarium TaxID=3059160 RepID=A0ABP1EAJ3_9APHY